MNIYYPAYLLLQKTNSEHLRALKNLTVYKANEWEDDFGKKIQSSVVFEAIAFLERKKLVSVTSFRECSTCSITEEGRQTYKKFESSEEYKAYLKGSGSLALSESNMQLFFDHKNKEQYQEKQMAKLSNACSVFFGAL
jgi:Fe-S cluster assembly scaffold protein SufB